MFSKTTGFVFLLTVLFLGVSGCGTIREVTDQERTESFAPFEERKVGSESLRKHVMSRVALIFNAADFSEINRSGSDKVEFKAEGDGSLLYGTAAAVDRRGYFVTAAHCIDDQAVSLGFPTPTGIELRNARVVYRGDRTSRHFDFAILHVPEPLYSVFEWEVNPRAGDRVVSAGIHEVPPSEEPDAPQISFRVDSIGGRIQGILPREAKGMDFHLVQHDLPLSLGNSGGPLTSETGRLVAVNFARAAFPFPFKEHRLAFGVRPDPQWVARVIEEDVKSAN